MQAPVDCTQVASLDAQYVDPEPCGQQLVTLVAQGWWHWGVGDTERKQDKPLAHSLVLPQAVNSVLPAHTPPVQLLLWHSLEFRHDTPTSKLLGDAMHLPAVQIRLTQSAFCVQLQ